MNFKKLVKLTVLAAVVAVVAPASALAAPAAPTISLGPATLTNSSTLNFEFNSPGAFSYECATDGGDYGSCTSPYVIPALGDGPHTFTVRANVMETVQQCTDLGPPIGMICVPMPMPAVTEVASYAFTVDRTLPTLAFTNGPKDRSSSKSANVTFVFTSEAGSTFTCALDAQAAAACASPLKLKKLKAGIHRLTISPTDPAGNVGKPATRLFAVNSKTKNFKFVKGGKVKQCAVKKKKLVKCKTKKV